MKKILNWDKLRNLKRKVSEFLCKFSRSFSIVKVTGYNLNRITILLLNVFNFNYEKGDFKKFTKI